MNAGEQAGQGSDEGPRLAGFVERRREDVLRRWEERVRAVVPSANDLSEPALRDHVPKILAWVVDVLRSASEDRREPPEVLASLHARSRIAGGYDVNEVVRELALLRQAILELWEAESGPHVAVNEVRRLNYALDLSIAHSVRVFADAREQDLREHLDLEQQMIGIVSHDLKQPLHSITLAVDGLLQKPRDDRTMRALVRIGNVAQRATRLIRDLLDFTSVRGGKGIPLNPQPCDLHAIARDVVAEMGARAAGRDIALVQDGDGSAVLDVDRIAQVVENLLANALKYSPPNTTVTVRTRGEPEGLSLAVHNSGDPITEEARGRLFQPLQRGVDPSVIEHRKDGVGLGLYIVDNIVRAHGGAVTVTSTAEEGTTFTVRLPRSAAGESQGRRTKEGTSAG